MKVEGETGKDARGYLLAAALITVVGWQFEYGQLALYPFTLLATYAHEMGHGLTALVLGADFERLILTPAGGGIAYWRGDMGRISRALIAAGGLVGPSFAGVIVLWLSRNRRRAAWVLAGLGLLLMATVVLFARGLFAPIFLASVAAFVLLVARYLPQRGAPFLLQLIGVQLCLSVFRDVSYMFSEGGLVGGVPQRSDSAAIADALLLPYWVWGSLTALVSFLFLALGLYVALRPHSPAVPPAVAADLG